MKKKCFKRMLFVFCAITLFSINFFDLTAFSQSEQTPDFGYIYANNEKLPVYTFQKSGNDNENFNILFLGDGYTETQQQKFINDAKKRVELLLSKEPFSKYSKKINIYAVLTVSNEEGVSVGMGDEMYEDKDTYFGMRHYDKVCSLSQKGVDKANQIRYALEDYYMDKGGNIGTIHILSNSLDYFGASTSRMFSCASLNSQYSDGSTSVHEIAHSIGGLRDEYGAVINGNNASVTDNYEDIPWKKLFGFHGVGVVNNGNAEKSFIPTLSCIMKDLDNSDFCEVCKLELAIYLNSKDYTNAPEEYYVANPQITVSENHENYYGTYVGYPIDENNIRYANGNSLEFRTVVQNLSDCEKYFKLSFEITDRNGTRKYYNEKTVSVPPLEKDKYNDARESVAVTLDNVSRLVVGDKIVGKVTDIDSNTVVETDKSQYFKVKINHKLKNPDGSVVPVSNTSPTIIYVLKNTPYKPKFPKHLNGYSYVSNSLNDEEILVTEDTEIDFYYKNDFVGTVTTVSNDKKTYEINGYKIEEGSKVILALYDKNKLEKVKCFTFGTEEMKYVSDKIYNKGKVMVWKKDNTLIPLCNAENIIYPR